jgi:hypothetical protein
VGVVPVGEANDTPTLPFCGAEVVWCFTILVKMARYLAVAAGVTTMTASEAGWLRTCGGGRASLEVVRFRLVKLTLLLTKLWVLPYKGLEAA